MSSVYMTEPPTNGKVLIQTNFGDIDVELWSKEAPLACRNFLQLIMEGYYDNTIVHRVIKGFMVQLGDPTGTGQGGSSVWGRPFKDEFHSKLKFTHRGQVAMANENKPHSNQSQFFITLDACPWLEKKHTIFGKVTGNTIFNVLRMGEVEVEGDAEKPVDDIRVLRVEVLYNPFSDIAPRKTETESATLEDDGKQKKVTNRKATKDKKLLSFAAEDGEDEDAAVTTIRIKSSHDSRFKDKKLSSRVPTQMKHLLPDTVANTAVVSSISGSSGIDNNNDDDDDNGIGGGTNEALHFDRRMRDKVIAEKREAMQQRSSTTAASTASAVVVGNADMQQLVVEAKRGVEIQQKSAEYQQLRDAMLKAKRAVNVLTGAQAQQQLQEVAGSQMASALELRRLKYTKRKNDFGDRSDQTMAKLLKFTQSIRSVKSAVGSGANSSSTLATTETAVNEEDKEKDESYRGQVLERDDDNDELRHWYADKLKCKKHLDHSYRSMPGSDAAVAVGSDGRALDDYAVIDTRKQQQRR